LKMEKVKKMRFSELNEGEKFVLLSWDYPGTDKRILTENMSKVCIKKSSHFAIFDKVTYQCSPDEVVERR